VVAQLLVVVALGIWSGVTGRRQLSFGAIALGQLALWTGLLGAPLYATYRKGRASLARDFGLVVRANDVGLGLAVGLASQLLLVPLIYLPFHSLLKGKSLDQPAKDLADKAHGPTFLLLAVVIVVGAPVVEELFFRGLLLRAVARRFGDGWGLAVSSVVFALAHFEGIQLPALIAVGVVFGLLALRRGRLGPGIFAHAAFNAVVVAILAHGR
jgi:uncharacterized protein